jgi:hypothetical protein
MTKQFDIQAHVKSGVVMRFGSFFITRRPAPAIECVDGFIMSVQASETHYCAPRDYDGPYAEFEVGFPSEREEQLMPYAEDPERPLDTVYRYVPLEIIEALVEKHGGVT